MIEPDSAPRNLSDVTSARAGGRRGQASTRMGKPYRDFKITESPQPMTGIGKRRFGSRRIAAAVGRRISLAVLVLVGLHAPVSGEALRPKFSTSYTYYDITGTTAKQLYRQMATRGPASGAAIATAQPDLDWSVDCKCKKRSCRLIVYALRVSTKITLPRWKPPRNAPYKLKSSWARFVKEVKKHELVHRDIFNRTGRKLLRSIKLMRPNRTCKGVERSIKALAAKTFKRNTKDNERFHRDFHRRWVQRPVNLVDR